MAKVIWSYCSSVCLWHRVQSALVWSGLCHVDSPCVYAHLKRCVDFLSDYVICQIILLAQAFVFLAKKRQFWWKLVQLICFFPLSSSQCCWPGSSLLNLVKGNPVNTVGFLQEKPDSNKSDFRACMHDEFVTAKAIQRDERQDDCF